MTHVKFSNVTRDVWQLSVVRLKFGLHLAKEFYVCTLIEWHLNNSDGMETCVRKIIRVYFKFF